VFRAIIIVAKFRKPTAKKDKSKFNEANSKNSYGEDCH
jgi:hypothetical protein